LVENNSRFFLPTLAFGFEADCIDKAVNDRFAHNDFHELDPFAQ
jgi:hypothetical protein